MYDTFRKGVETNLTNLPSLPLKRDVILKFTIFAIFGKFRQVLKASNKGKYKKLKCHKNKLNSYRICDVVEPFSIRDLKKDGNKLPDLQISVHSLKEVITAGNDETPEEFLNRARKIAVALCYEATQALYDFYTANIVPQSQPSRI